MDGKCKYRANIFSFAPVPREEEEKKNFVVNNLVLFRALSSFFLFVQYFSGKGVRSFGRLINEGVQYLSGNEFTVWNTLGTWSNTHPTRHD